jgi:two-component system, OmpR family, sensor kinase
VSIRRNLLLALLSALVLVGLAATATTWFAARNEADELFDYQLRQMALSLRDQTLQSQTGGVFPDLDYDFIVQVWDPSGSRLYLSNQNISLPQGEPGFETVSMSGEDWRVFTLANGTNTIQVAQPMSLRRDRAASIALRILVPVFASIPLFALLIWLIVGRGLHPLRSVTRAIGARAPSSLEPLPQQGLPSEIQPMVAQLNGLLARLAEAIETQRRFTADAAHELRSPLTALQLQIQLVERAQSAEERREMLEQLKAGARRAARLVEQLLTMARLEPEAARRARGDVALDRLAASVVADFETLAGAKGVEMRLGRIEPAQVAGDQDALRILLGNLVDNAIRYTSAGGSVMLDVFALDGNAVLAVTDTGPGIAPEERQRVFDRFYRIPGSAAQGSGLGLAIVKQIAASHGAAIELGERDAGHGLRVTVRFGAGKLARATGSLPIAQTPAVSNLG